ncbi:MAG: alanine--tRNA ligase [Caldilineaceae bacterium]
MKSLSTYEIRQLFLEYFHELHHEIVASSSLVPSNDPTLLLTNAGMNQFKDVFLGAEKRPYKRATTAQKVMRVSGKHNDLENVGPSPRHHTFFEMLGNFSFGDYFKKDAIRYAWHLLVNELGLDLNRLWFTVYETDEEAEKLWIETGASPDRVLRFGKKDNWWAMGDTGPCGPCSEIHYYWGDLSQQVPGGVNKDDEYLEIWNLVFMQFDAKPDGTLVPLPAPSVDTGAGLERLASIVQGKDNNYDTDAFTPIMDRIQSLLGQTREERQSLPTLYRYRAIADHARSCAFMICDGVLPGNEGRNYVLRMILRRAARFGKLLGFNEPFLAKVAEVVIEQMGGHYTDLIEKRDYILNTITDEEERFHITLNTGLARLDELMEKLKADGQTVIPGAEAFKLWETFGFPIDITRDIAGDNGYTVDEAGFRVAREEAQETSRAGGMQFKQDLSAYTDLLSQLRAEGVLGDAGVKHLIYDNVAEAETTVAAILVDGKSVTEAHAGTQVEIVLTQTPFYAESGGQVGDTGEIYYWPEDVAAAVWAVEISDTRKRIPGIIVHIGKVTSGTVKVNDPAWAAIDADRRWDVMRNHTGTHVLHAVLRERLGNHVHQAGSLVAPDRLRFDFTHNQSLSKADLNFIEQEAAEIILANFPVNTRWTTLQQARKEGATALFGEKYDENNVRVVSFGEQEDDGPVSMELCGGTHVESTAEIGGFRVLGEGSVSAGVRRIEIVTGHGAEQLVEERLGVLNRAADLLRIKPDGLELAVRQLQEQNSQLQRELAQLRQKLSQQDSESLLNQAVRVDGFAVLATQVNAASVDAMRQMSDWFRDKLGSSVVTLGAVIDDKPMIVASVTEDLIKRGLHAGNIVRDVAKLIGGGGGGRPNMAQAGGKDSSKLGEALSSVNQWVKQNLK